MKATDLLTEQHHANALLLAELGTTHVDLRGRLNLWASQWVAHRAIEEQLFYPAIGPIDRSLMLRCSEEAAIASYALARLIAVEPEDDTFEAKLSTLKLLHARHVDIEETNLFPRVEAALSAQQLDELGAQMAELYTETAELGFERALNEIGSSMFFKPVDSSQPSTGPTL